MLVLCVSMSFMSERKYVLLHVLQEYITLDLHAAIRDQGFGAPLQKESTPRHRTVVAVKP